MKDTRVRTVIFTLRKSDHLFGKAEIVKLFSECNSLYNVIHLPGWQKESSIMQVSFHCPLSTAPTLLHKQN